MICILCKHNGRERCPHRWVNDANEIKRKISALTQLILEDARKMKGDESLQLRDILPVHPVDVLVGYANSQFQWDRVSLRRLSTRTARCSTDRMQLPPEEYARHIHHTEELVASRTAMVYDPKSITKTTDLTNIEFVLGRDAMKDSKFHSNV